MNSSIALTHSLRAASAETSELTDAGFSSLPNEITERIALEALGDLSQLCEVNRAFAAVVGDLRARGAADGSVDAMNRRILLAVGHNPRMIGVCLRGKDNALLSHATWAVTNVSVSDADNSRFDLVVYYRGDWVKPGEQPKFALKFEDPAVEIGSPEKVGSSSGWVFKLKRVPLDAIVQDMVAYVENNTHRSATYSTQPGKAFHIYSYLFETGDVAAYNDGAWQEARSYAEPERYWKVDSKSVKLARILKQVFPDAYRLGRHFHDRGLLVKPKFFLFDHHAHFAK